MLRYFIFIEYGLLPDLRVGVLISASQTKNGEKMLLMRFMIVQKALSRTTKKVGCQKMM